MHSLQASLAPAGDPLQQLQRTRILSYANFLKQPENQVKLALYSQLIECSISAKSSHQSEASDALSDSRIFKRGEIGEQNPEHKLITQEDEPDSHPNTHCHSDLSNPSFDALEPHASQPHAILLPEIEEDQSKQSPARGRKVQGTRAQREFTQALYLLCEREGGPPMKHVRPFLNQLFVKYGYTDLTLPAAKKKLLICKKFQYISELRKGGTSKGRRSAAIKAPQFRKPDEEVLASVAGMRVADLILSYDEPTRMNCRAYRSLLTEARRLDADETEFQ